MEVNLVSQINFILEEKNENLFHQIMEKTEKLLHLDKQYLFSVIFVDSEMIHEINKEYRGIDRTTDVISFALKDSEDQYERTEELEEELGDIFINVDRAYLQAKEYGHSFDRELSFLFTHGLLHLLGYDHQNVEEEKIMFALQDEILYGIIEK